MKLSSTKRLLVQGFLCILIAGFILYAYIEKQNALTELRREIPRIVKQVNEIKEKNIRLQYEIDQFESPIHLRELARQPEYGHLHYPYLNQILIIQEQNNE